MSEAAFTVRLSILVLLAGWVVGCQPLGSSADSEKRDPDYQQGLQRVRELDYTGAAESFEKALQNNPKSAPAHFELAMVFYQHTTNWASAIHHFERYRRYRPGSNVDDSVQQFIRACKQELIKDAPVGSIDQALRQELERVTRDRTQLQQQVDQLRIQLAQARLAVTNTLGPIPTNRTPASLPPPPAARPPASQPQSPPAGSPAVVSTRTHTVRGGETAFGIARRYGISVEALVSANPGLDARRLRTGQVLKLPPP